MKVFVLNQDNCQDVGVHDDIIRLDDIRYSVGGLGYNYCHNLETQVVRQLYDFIHGAGGCTFKPGCSLYVALHGKALDQLHSQKILKAIEDANEYHNKLVAEGRMK